MKTGHLIILFLLLTSSFRSYSQESQEATAGMGNVELKAGVNKEGKPYYAVYYKGRTVIGRSDLGFRLADDSLFYRNFNCTAVIKDAVDESWTPVWGEVSSIRNRYQQLTLKLEHRDSKQRKLNIVFRVFEDGVGFRYEFPHQPGMGYFIVKDELTSFVLTGNHKAFWIPGDYDTNEYPYTTCRLTGIDNRELVNNSADIAVRVAPDPFAVQTPLMLKSDQGLYINIHEAALTNYSAMQLHVDKSNYQLRAALVPNAYGDKAYLKTPATTPWRTIVVSDRAADILASKMILNLNEPGKLKDTGWIKPMKFVGVWWELQTAKSSWNYAASADTLDANGNLIPNGTHGANTNNVKRYIDFASRNKIEGVLVEGWNVGWEDWFGNWKEDVFDFVTPYPDFDVSHLQQYAASKGVKLIMHNETSGSATNYERHLDTAFRFMNKFGYPAVKTGYVGKIIPRGEHHDGQWMVQHYERVLQKAAAHKVTVDMHEAVRPTGLHRTWPNFMASEAGRGNEYNAFSIGNTPDHETILPFTRLMGGPMDYTPGIFKLNNYTTNKARRVRTTLAKQLALYVTLYSPFQMVADLPENYDAYPDAFRFIQTVPVDWADTRIIDAEPGDYVTIARKDKHSAAWFVGAITDEKARKSTLDLRFLDPGRVYEATIYEDGKNADYNKNPESYRIRTEKVNSRTCLKLSLAAGGGTAIAIVPADRR